MTMKNKNMVVKRFAGVSVAVMFAAVLALTVAWYYGAASNDASNQSVSTGQSAQGDVSDSEKQTMDRELTKQLLVHNQQTIEIIDIELARGQSPALRMLAQEMRQARTDEVEDIMKLLKKRGEPYQSLTDTTQAGKNPMHMGMATTAQLTDLRTLPEQSVDERFLDLISRSVDGSYDIAANHEAASLTAEVEALAQQIRATRSSERTALAGHAGMHDETGSHH